jgi:phospholipid/cholesterol/gamma-HCH transport system substrate-binding protein
VNDIFDRIDRILKYIDTSEGTVGKLVNERNFARRIDGITAGVTQIEADFKTGRGAALHIEDITSEAHKPMARLNDIVSDLNNGKGSLGKFLNDPNNPSLTAEANATIAVAKQIFDNAAADKRPADLLQRVQLTNDKVGALLDRIESGQGTAGQLLVNPQLRDSLNRVQSELNSLIAAIGKHPTKFVQLRFGLF